MKKLFCALLICALCACTLTACRKQAATDAASKGEPAPAEQKAVPDETRVPEEGGHGEEDQSRALEAMPTLAPAETLSGEGTPADAGSDEYYSIDALINQSTQEFDTYDESAQQKPRADVKAIDPSTVQFSALVDTAMGFTFNYPSNWVNVPGIYTVCFREAVEPGDFPARVAITGKLLVHSPEGTVLTDELTA